MSFPDWGNVPAWAGVIVTAWGLRYAGRQVKLNTEQRREDARRAAEEAERYRQRHARRVNVVGQWRERAGFRVKMTVTAENHGDEPIIRAQPLWTVPDTFADGGTELTGASKRIAPHESVTWDFFVNMTLLSPDAALAGGDPPPVVSLQFLDVAGDWWLRGDTGSLAEDAGPGRQ